MSESSRPKLQVGLSQGRLISFDLSELECAEVTLKYPEAALGLPGDCTESAWVISRETLVGPSAL